MNKKKELLKPKSLSKWGIVCAMAIVVVLSLVKSFWVLLPSSGEFGLSMSDIVTLGIFLIGGWSPVFTSIWIDKFKNKNEYSEYPLQSDQAGGISGWR